MKLRNKKTGEIRTAYVQVILETNHPEKPLEFHTQPSIAELNEDWEDYEEPKSGIEDIRLNDMISGRHIVEIDFTKVEEAEKAVEKLKAWKRLKDKGFKFTGWGLFEYAGCDNFVHSPQIGFSIPTLDKDEPYEYPEEIERDVDLLFVGEEGE